MTLCAVILPNNVFLKTIIFPLTTLPNQNFVLQYQLNYFANSVSIFITLSTELQETAYAIPNNLTIQKINKII